MVMKEYGSNFELSYTPGEGNKCVLRDNDNIFYLRSARECLLLIGQIVSNKGIDTVFIPALCCVSMVQAFIQIGMKVVYYRLDSHLRIDYDYLDINFRSNSLLLLIKYHGMNTYESDAIKHIVSKYNNIQIVQDCTQHIFTDDLYDDLADYHIGSLRKWIAIPDGAFLFSRNAVNLKDAVVKSDNDEFVRVAYEAMVEKTEYLMSGCKELKKQYREKNAYCMNYLREKIIPTELSFIAKNIISNDIDFQDVIYQRRNNYNILHDAICKRHPDILRFTVGQECPLCFPLFVNNRNNIQMILAEKGVFCQVLWPLPEAARIICNNSLNYSEHTLAIPCDQRYSREDMNVISKMINEIIDEE